MRRIALGVRQIGKVVIAKGMARIEGQHGRTHEGTGIGLALLPQPKKNTTDLLGFLGIAASLRNKSAG
jgi:hypothetical protein